MITFTPLRPRENGQVEACNKLIINNLKKRLTKRKRIFVEELPLVLWEDSTTTKNSIEKASYSLVFGSEAVIPPEVMILTTRTRFCDQDENRKILAEDLDTVGELRDLGKIRIAAYR